MQTDGQTALMKLIVAFHSSVNEPKKSAYDYQFQQNYWIRGADEIDQTLNDHSDDFIQAPPNTTYPCCLLQEEA